MPLTFEPVSTPDQLAHLACVADEIWHEYWPPIIGQAQTDYMVRMFHSVEAMQKDIRDLGYRFWMLYDESGDCVGYTGGAAEVMNGDPVHDSRIMHNEVVQSRWGRRFFISKVYLYAQARGRHYASEVLAFYEDLCREEGLDAMYLTVNVNNVLGIRAYKGNGLST